MQYQKLKKKLYLFATAAILTSSITTASVYATDSATATDEIVSLEDSSSTQTSESDNLNVTEISQEQSASENDTGSEPKVEVILNGQEALQYPQLMPVEEKKELSEVEKTQWIIEKGDPRVYSTTIKIPAGTTRLEVFYSAAATPPVLEFQSLNDDIYRTGKISNGSANFVTRTGLQVESYSNINYEVIYISNPADPGTWKVSISLDEKINEMFIVKSAVPDNWEGLITDYKTACNDVMLWFIDNSSKYNASDIPDIVKKDTQIPSTNIMTPVEEPQPVNEINYASLIIKLIIFMIVVVGSFIGYKTYVAKKDDLNLRKRKVDKANKIVQKMKQKENDTLDEVLKQYADEYEDEIEYGNDEYEESQSAEEPFVASQSVTEPEPTTVPEPTTEPVAKSEPVVELKPVTEPEPVVVPEPQPVLQSEQKPVETFVQKQTEPIDIVELSSENKTEEPNRPVWAEPKPVQKDDKIVPVETVESKPTSEPEQPAKTKIPAWVQSSSNNKKAFF